MGAGEIKRVTEGFKAGMKLVFAVVIPVVCFFFLDVYKRQGDTPNEAWEKAQGQYGRVDDAVKIIDPRKE